MHRIHYLIWRRGFAPIFFILAIALIFVAAGSGIYFATKKNAPVITAEQPVVNQQIETVATSTAPIATATIPIVATAKPVAATQVAAQYFNCNTFSDTLSCLASSLQECSPAKGTAVDPVSGMKVERIIDGYKGGKCSYRSKIITAPGAYAIIEGMNFDCMVPKAMLATTVRPTGSMSNKDMLAYCTGTFMDLMRAQTGSSQ